MNNLLRYVKSIVEQTDCTKEEKEDLEEELLIHLEMLTEEKMREGKDEEQAILEAIQTFGKENELGPLLQEAMFPYRRKFLISLGLATIILCYSVYTLYLFEYKESLNIVMLNVLSGVGLLLITAFPCSSLKRKIITNSLLIVSLIGMALHYIVLIQLDYILIGNVLFGINIILALTSITLIYMTTLHKTKNDKSSSSSRKHIHIINITTGLFITIASFALALGVMAFVGYGISFVLVLVPAIIWGILYWIQIKYYKRLGWKTYIFSCVTAIPSLFILTFLLFNLIR